MNINGNLNGLDKMAIDLLCASVVTGQKATFKSGEGVRYLASCKHFEGLTITIIKKNGTILCKNIYNNETMEEKNFYEVQ